MTEQHPSDLYELEDQLNQVLMSLLDYGPIGLAVIDRHMRAVYAKDDHLPAAS